VLATANATDLLPTPDRARALYVSDGSVMSVPTDASTGPVELIAGTATGATLVAALSPDSSQVLALVSDGLRRAPVATAGAEARLDDASVAPASLGWSGDGARAVWRNGAELRAAAGTGTATPVASDVSAWWSIPGASRVLYLTGSGALVLEGA